MNEIKAILDKIVAVLSTVPGIHAIVLGGSRAGGTHSPSSDIDIGIYYDDPALDIDALNKATQEVDDEHRKNLIASPGGWGKWVNGGGWLIVDGYSVDFILRDIARVEKRYRGRPKGDCNRTLPNRASSCLHQYHVYG